MYHPVRKKGITFTISTISILTLTALYLSYTQAKSFDASIAEARTRNLEDVDNNVIDFEDDHTITLGNKYDRRDDFNKESHRYTIINDDDDNLNKSIFNDTKLEDKRNAQDTTDGTTPDYSVIPLELISTTENKLISILESTTEADLTVIPLSTTNKIPKIEINDTVTLPSSTNNYESTTYYTPSEPEMINEEVKLTVIPIHKVQNDSISKETTTKLYFESTTGPVVSDNVENVTSLIENFDEITSTETASKREVIYTTSIIVNTNLNETIGSSNKTVNIVVNSTSLYLNETEDERLNASVNNNQNFTVPVSYESEEEVPVFTELDADEEKDIPEDYYDAKDVVPTTAPKTDALSVIFGLAGSVVESVVESVAERVVPKSIFDLFKRMQRQNEALEAEKLRSREENGGIGQFTRGIIKSISSGISRPLSQLMAGARDIGSLDTDRSFVSSIASGVTSVANVAYSVADAFKDRVQAIYPGTVWCGDGRSASARSSDLGLFFFTDTCCRQHDACKLYIRAGETKYGLTNTGLFTRSHCSCDLKFRECLRQTNSLVSSQIGLTYFNVLGPQCFRRAHPIVRCVRRTRITGLKCEEYELDYTKPRMWQWFDNETF